MRRKRFYRIISYILVFSLVLGTLNLTEIGKRFGAIRKVNAMYSSTFWPANLSGNGPDDIVTIAEAQVGNNSMYPYAWCAAFVSDCASIVGQSSAIPGSTVVANLYTNVMNAGGQIVNSPQRGDLVFYYCTTDNRWCHVGIMKNSTYSIQGNVSGIVYDNLIPSYYRDVNGACYTITYVRPKYITSAQQYTITSYISYGNVTSSSVKTSIALNVSGGNIKGIGYAIHRVGHSEEYYEKVKETSSNKITMDLWSADNTLLKPNTDYQYISIFIDDNGVRHTSEIKYFKTPEAPATPDSNGWYTVSSLPSNITSDKYEIQYNHTYYKNATTSPGSGWTDTGEDVVNYAKSGSPYETYISVATSDTVRLDGWYYYHFCGGNMGGYVNYEFTSSYNHYDEIRDVNSVTVVDTAPDSDIAGLYSYKLNWNSGGLAYCSSGKTCDGSNGSHGNRGCHWYKMYRYQNYTKTVLNKYKKVSGWVTTKDTSANEISIRYRLKPTNVTLNLTSKTLTSKGATVKLIETVTPSDAADKSVTWTSSNPAVATVSSTGLVTAVANGTTTITCKTNSGAKTKTATITVNIPIVPTGVTLNKTSAILTTKGETVQLKETVAPSTATDKSVTWTSSNPSVATVNSSGVVTAVASGTTTITCKTNSGAKTATATIDVSLMYVSVVKKQTVADGVYAIRPATATNYAVGLYQNGNWNNNNVLLHEYSIGNDFQKWEITYQGDGYYRIKNAGYDKYLNVNGGTKSSGTNVTIYEEGGNGVSSDQRWIIIDRGNGNYNFVPECNERYFLEVREGKFAVDTNVGIGVQTLSFDQKFILTKCNIFDVNGRLDGVWTSYGSKDYVTFDLAVDGKTIQTNAYDVFRYIPVGSKYELINIKTKDGKMLDGFTSNSGVVNPVDGGKSGTMGDAMTTVTVIASTIPTGVSLDKAKATLTTKGETVKLSATVEPTTTSKKDVTWTSSNTSVATVSNTGVVTAVANGTTTITCKTNSGAKTATATITVNIHVVPTGVTLNKTSATLTSKGATVQLSATVAPSGATDKSVTWTSSNTAVATVSSTGVVTAVANGTTTITCKTNSGAKTATATITVNIPVVPTGVTLNKTSATLTSKGQTVQLSATVTPSGATDKSVTWTSSNTSVATVSSSGVVTAVANGTTTITCKTNSGAKTATATITVSIPSVNENDMQIIVDSVKASKGNTVKVNISLKNNPGIIGLMFKVGFGTNLTLMDIEYSSQYMEGGMISESLNNPVMLCWDNVDGSKSDGLFATLTFRINDDAVSGSYEEINVTFNPDDIYDSDTINVPTTVINGGVSVTSYMAGDINGDGKVNLKDVTRLKQYLLGWKVTVVDQALDVNGDGKVNLKDVTRLKQYLLGWKVSIH